MKVETVKIYPGTFIKTGSTEEGRFVGMVDILVDDKPLTATCRFNGDAYGSDNKLRVSNMIVGGFLLKGKPLDYKFPFEIPDGLVYDPEMFDRKRDPKLWSPVDL